MAKERERDDHGRFHVDESELEKRRLEVVRLHVGGYSFREIGRQLGIRESQSYRDFKAVMDRTREEADATVDEHRRVSLARLDKAIAVLVPMLDDEERCLEAMDRLDKLEKRRAALLGLDAPTKVSAEVASVGLDEIDALRKAAQANACSSSDPQKPPSENEPSS